MMNWLPRARISESWLELRTEANSDWTNGWAGRLDALNEAALTLQLGDIPEL